MLVNINTLVLSKVITWLRLLLLVIGWRDSRQFYNQWEAKPKPVAPFRRDFSRALSELHLIVRNCDWFIAVFVSVVIGRINCLGFVFSTVIWKPFDCCCCYWFSGFAIHLIPKWRAINYSFVSMLISPLRLIFPSKFFCFFDMLTRRRALINMRTKEEFIARHFGIRCMSTRQFLALGDDCAMLPTML